MYVITEKDRETSKAIISSIIPLFSHNAHVLIGPGSTQLFISCIYAKHASLSLMMLDLVLLVFTPLEKSLITNLVLKSCAIMVRDLELLTDLILLDIDDFDVILGMDWLTAYHAIVHCYSKEVVFQIPGLAEFSFQGVEKDSLSCLISAIQAGKLLQIG